MTAGAFVLPFLRGLGLGASLIIAIGAQNAFVLRQGLRREQAVLVAAICAACDACLIALGTAGVGSAVAHLPLLARLASWLGAAFLFFYGAAAFRRAAHPAVLDAADFAPATRGSIAAATLSVSLLNPHVYLDTVVLVGGISAQYSAFSRLFFAAGAVSASCLWFFSLALGAAHLAPLFRRPGAWRILDGGVGLVMWTIAFGLVRSSLNWV